MLLFPNGSCIKESHLPVYIVLEMLKFFIYYVVYYKMCEITTKLPF